MKPEGQLRRRIVLAELEVVADDAVESTVIFNLLPRANECERPEVVHEWACELFPQSGLVVEVNVRVSEEVDELVRDAVGHLRDKVGEESGADEVEREAEADVGGSLVNRAGETGLWVVEKRRQDRLVHVKLVQDRAGRDCHVVDICGA